MVELFTDVSHIEIDDRIEQIHADADLSLSLHSRSSTHEFARWVESHVVVDSQLPHRVRD